MPTRRIRDVVLGLEQLFGDLIDFDDALNQQAAQQYQTNKVQGFCWLLGISVLNPKRSLKSKKLLIIKLNNK